MSISIAVRASFYMALYLVGLHTLLMIALLLLVSGLLLQTLAVVLVVCSLLYSLWRYATDHSICWIKRISYQESCWILLTKGGECSASLQQATVWRWLVVMNFYSEQTACHYRLVLLPDSCDKDLLRRLKMMIRHLPVWQI